ncbi:putative carboxylesterase [Abeliophyllum distichum]|uniref:Carboxylesterase n=1 Tax=Abeliophyllum distichum TaxID=126358 RepID=A0ABD1UNK6_9LAMI
MKILGRFLSHPYFCGSKPIESETKEETEQNVAYKIWLFVYPSALGGIDNPMINPFVDDVPSLSELACLRLLVYLAEKDPLMSREILYVENVKKSGWNGKVELVGVEGEDHCFHFFDLDLP